MHRLFDDVCWRLDAVLGPTYCENGMITGHIPKDLRVANDIPCSIEIRNYKQREIITGLGAYYGNGHVLTAHHVLEDQYGSTILVMFPTEKGFLVYKGQFTKYCNAYPDRDQAFLKLLGNTDPLGNGLQNQIGNVHDQKDNVYFYTIKDSGHFQKQECKVICPNPDMKPHMCYAEFILSKAGRKGDSGSPVFCNGKWVGIYRGAFSNVRCNIEFGRGTEMYPEMNPWVLPAERNWFDQLFDQLFGILKKTGCRQGKAME